MKTVYLAGPITGLTFDGCVEWRDDVTRRLHAKGIKGLSPMRAKHYLKAIAADTPFTPDGDAFAIHNPLSTNRGIMTRDRHDATHCDVLLVNMLGAQKASIGTCMEIAWADLCRIPIVMVMEPGNVHEHGMVLEAIGYRVGTLDEALAIVEAIICPDPLAFVDAA